MNNIYSRHDEYGIPEYLERWLTPTLRAAIDEHQILVLTGARQVGKSTLLRNASPFSEWQFRTMDDFDVLQQAQTNPEALWAGTDRIILDEVQKVPTLLPAIKQTVDENPGRYRFVLSGSANLLLMSQVSESLAGRAIYFILAPLTIGEKNKQPPPSILTDLLMGQWPDENVKAAPELDPIPILSQGLMPALLPLSSSQSWIRWWDGYITTYLERDLRQISQIDRLVDFRQVMELLALRTGQLLNQSELGRDAKLAQPTVHRYLNLLETTHLFTRLQAYTKSHTTRLLKSPKVMWTDPALAIFLAGYYGEDALRDSRELGSFFESLIYHHLRVLAGLMTPAARLYFWRTKSGREVDFVLEYGRSLLAIEVKRTGKPKFSDAAGLRAFLDAYPNATGGVLLHGGTMIQRLDEKILAIPWPLVCGY